MYSAGLVHAGNENATCTIKQGLYVCFFERESLMSTRKYLLPSTKCQVFGQSIEFPILSPVLCVINPAQPKLQAEVLS